MSPESQFDDDAFEAIVRGETTGAAELPRFAAFARHVRAAGDLPAPRPSPSLAALLKGHEDPGLRPVAAPTPSSPSRRSAVTGRARRSKRRHRVPVIETLSAVAAKVAGMSALTKAAVGTGAVVVGTATAGAAGVAGPVNAPVQGIVETVTPLELGGEDVDAVVNVEDGGASADAEADAAGAGAEADASTGDVAGTAGGAVGTAEGVVDGVADDAVGTATGTAGAAVGEVEETTGDVVDAVEEEVNETPVGGVVPDLPEVTVPTTPPLP